MISLTPARRRAERFDSLVEGRRPDDVADDVDGATSDLLELVGALRSVPEAQARPEFVADLRERLVVAARTELAPANARERKDVERLTISPTRTRRERRVALALGTVAVLGATTSMAYASQGALPGDALYPLKRVIENTETGFSHGEDAKGQAILGDASVRLDEVDELTRAESPDAHLITQTLDTFSQQATDASHHLLAGYEQTGQAASIQQLHQFTQHSIDQLSALAAVIPSGAHPALAHAAAVLMNIDHAATDACPACGDGVAELPPQLVADAAHTLDQAAGAVADGTLGGTTPPPSIPSGRPHPHGGKGTQVPSGLNPPQTPIQLPPQPSDATHALGNLVPSPGSGPTSSGTGGGTAGSTSGNGGKHHHAHVDLSPVTNPVTTTVNGVVNGVVDGVTGLMSGLTGSAK